MKLKQRLLVAALGSMLGGAASAAIEIKSADFGGLTARNIGPAVMSGRISAMDAFAEEGEPITIYVGTASGGVWKSDDGGIVYTPVFDDHNQSIGAIAVDPSNTEVVWVGTGESWVRNTVSVGDGVYRSTNGGDKWEHVGLADSEHISAMVIDPNNTDTVYVCSMGHLWNAGGERGVFRTTDAGQSWENVLYVDEDTSCSDIDISPDGSTLYAGMWQVRRSPDFFESGGPGSGLYRSTDGGDTWQELSEGLPEGDKGRIAVTVAPSKPEWVYATVESESTALFRSEDGGDTWERKDDSLNTQFRPFYFGELKVDPSDHLRVYKPAFSLTVSTDGGESFSGMFGAGFSISVHPDHHALWVNPSNPQQVVLGTDGGVYISYDKGFHWRHIANLPVSQFYHVAVDNQWPYNVYGGLQDNGSWMGPSRAVGGIQNRHWENIGFGDGFWAFPDPTDPDTIYSEFQGGQLKRINRNTSEIKRIQPAPAEGEDKLRFNWNTPLHLSSNRPGTIYYGSQYLHRSRDKGESWETISPDLTTNDPQGQRQSETGGLTLDNSTAENYTTIYTISESPVDGRVIWVGTDDGNIQLTRNGGRDWTNVAGNIEGVPAGTWVSRVDASPHDKATAFVTFDGHRRGDMNSYLLKTTDYGKTWTSLITDDIDGYAWVIRQDTVNENLLFLGTEFGLFISLDGGENWARFTENLPKVAVHDLVIHPTEHDLVLGTHGRGVYIIDDITPLRNLTQASIDSDIAVLPTRDAVMELNAQLQSFGAHDSFTAPNPPQSATVVYYLKKRHLFGDMKVEVFGDDGRLITTIPGGKRRGLNRVEWPMRFKAPKFPPATSLVPGFLGPRVPEGSYRVVITKGKETVETRVNLVPDPRTSHSARDRKLQQTLALELYDMINDLTFLSDNVISVRDELNARLEAGVGDHADAVSEFADRLETFRVSLSASREGAAISGEQKLRERMGNLYGNVTSFDGAPSRTQLQRRDVLRDDLDQALSEGNTLLSDDLKAVNALFEQLGQPTISIMERAQWNEKEGMAGFTGAVSKHFFRVTVPNAFTALSYAF